MLQNSQLSTYSKFWLKCPTFIINYFPEFTMRNICFPESTIKKKSNQIKTKNSEDNSALVCEHSFKKSIGTRSCHGIRKTSLLRNTKNEIRQEMRQRGFSLLEAMIVSFKSKIKCALRQASPECLFQQISNSEYVMCVVSLNYLSFVNFHRQTMQTTSV